MFDQVAHALGQRRDIFVGDQRRDLDEFPVARHLAGLDEARRIFLGQPLHYHDDRRVRVGLPALHRGQQLSVRLVAVGLAVGVFDLQRVVDDDGALPPFGHVAGTEAGDLATQRDGVDTASLLPVDDNIPALLRLGVIGNAERPERLILVRLDNLPRRL
ncbi:hypothetical protein D3C72_1752350 [compost metagenome]